MHYVIIRHGAKEWHVRLSVDDSGTLTAIGKCDSRKEALQIARLLAGWRGTVSVRRESRL
jgi:hypothetical protein